MGVTGCHARIFNVILRVSLLPAVMERERGGKKIDAMNEVGEKPAAKEKPLFVVS